MGIKNGKGIVWAALSESSKAELEKLIHITEGLNARPNHLHVTM